MRSAGLAGAAVFGETVKSASRRKRLRFLQEESNHRWRSREMARPLLWTPERIVVAIATWVSVVGAFPNYDDLDGARKTSQREAYLSLDVPSSRTVARYWRWSEFRGIYAELTRMWAAVVRDPWSEAPLSFLDWADVGFQLPVLHMLWWYREFQRQRVAEASDYATFWRWANTVGLIDAHPTFAGGPIHDLPTVRQREIRALRRDNRGLAFPRVLRFRTTDGWWDVEPSAPAGALSRSAEERIDERLRHSVTAAVGRTRPAVRDQVRLGRPLAIKPGHEAQIVAIHRRTLAEKEIGRRKYKESPREWDFFKAEWTDPRDRTRFCECDDASALSPYVVRTDPTGAEREVIRSLARVGRCQSCRARHPDVRPLGW
jgi:hypothetical protein